MILNIVLYKLKSDVNEKKLDVMIRNSKTQLLKIPEVLSIKCGKKVGDFSEWPFFIIVEVESMHKLKIYQDDPSYIKHNEEVIKPNTTLKVNLTYELDPGKNTKYS